MSRFGLKFYVMFLSLALTSITAIADTPGIMSYQGYLNDAAGIPVTDTLSMQFFIYDSAVDGNILWQESNSDVIVDSGYFSVVLGSTNPVPDSIFTRYDTWFSMEIQGETLEPRVALAKIPYAASVGSIEGADVGDGLSGDLITSGKGTIGPNVNDGDFAFAAGELNTAVGSHSTVAGGMGNITGPSDYSINSDKAPCEGPGDYSFVGGGRDNIACGDYSVIGGGWDNTAQGDLAVIGGGESNHITGEYSVIGGGYENEASGDTAFVGGGADNQASGSYSSVVGGLENMAGGKYAIAAGGQDNTAQGEYSFAAGRSANATHNGTFVWKDATIGVFGSSAENQFLIKASGGVGIGISDINTDSSLLKVQGIIHASAGGIRFPDGSLQTTASSGGTGSGDITAVYADDGLSGGGVTDDVRLSVNIGTGLEINADAVQMNSTYSSGSAYDSRFVNEGQSNSVNNSMITDGSISFDDIGQNGAAAGEFVKWDGANWTTDEINQTGDISAVYADDGLSGGGLADDVHLSVNTGTGLEISSDAVQMNSTYSTGSAYDNRFVNEGQSNSVNSSMITDGTIQGADIGANGADSGQVMMYNGSQWVPAENTPAAGLFPSPAYDSTIALSSGESVTLNHNLAQNPLNYIVDLQFIDIDELGRNNRNIGTNNFNYNSVYTRQGAYFSNLGMNTIMISKRDDATYCDSIRVRIWKVAE